MTLKYSRSPTRAFVGALHVMRLSGTMHSAEELKRYARHLNHVRVRQEAEDS